MEWKDINIRQYQDVVKEMKEEYPDPVDRAIGLLAALTGKEIHYYTNEIPHPELKKMLGGLAFLNEKPAPIKLHSRIKVGKKRYRFNFNMRAASFGNFMDLSQMVKDQDIINDNLHKILAVMCEEINFWGKTKPSTIMERAEYLKEHLRMDYTFSLSGFFLSNYQKLIIATNDYLESEMRKMNKRANKIVQAALSDTGDGTTR